MYLALAPITGAGQTALLIATPILVIVGLTWGYRGWMASIEKAAATAAEDQRIVDAFVSGLSVEQAETLTRAAIDAEMLIARPAQAGHTPEMPYGFPPDVGAFFHDFRAVFDHTGSLIASLEPDDLLDGGPPDPPEPGDVCVAVDSGEGLFVRPRTHELLAIGSQEEISPETSLWHWLLVRTIAVGDLHHDLRSSLRPLGLVPPEDPLAPSDPVPLTAADNRERKQRR